MTFEKTDGWHLIQSAGELISIDEQIPDDPIIKHLLEQWITPAMSAMIGIQPLPVEPAAVHAAHRRIGMSWTVIGPGLAIGVTVVLMVVLMAVRCGRRTSV